MLALGPRPQVQEDTAKVDDWSRGGGCRGSIQEGFVEELGLCLALHHSREVVERVFHVVSAVGGQGKWLTCPALKKLVVWVGRKGPNSGDNEDLKCSAEWSGS